MDSYLLLKLLHILAAVVVAGTGTGIAFFLFMANRSGNTQAIAVTTQHVIIGDWFFTLPAVITQLATGILLMNQRAYSFQSPWFLAVISLFIFIGLCWLPVLRIQYRLRLLATTSAERNCLSDDFKRLMRVWTLLGIPAFMAILVLFWLMVFKPLSVI